ncbi:peptide-methionine (S)-S-oxide reductase MsrA [Bacillus kwashiorkori]|uniref:peptide-methionine (S)-S-oxide reductase MsrA n=1 Tax=Bacillus kwashiorkori TaxID=1522318 RepID=UPI000785ED4E|nr:peptide-methionine (S)-S-oxide reductase MsrA [Bacillus kwashiorkori]
MEENLELATFAGGCFWCMVKPFDQWNGVHKVVSGYTGGTVENPTYEQVKEGETGHLEAVQITFDPDIISYRTLLNIYWQQIDPTDDGGQFHDRGSSYKTAIFYHSELQKSLAEESKLELQNNGTFSKPIITPILRAVPFYAAEDYHQDYYKKNPDEYLEDRQKSGRDEFIKKHWK